MRVIGLGFRSTTTAPALRAACAAFGPADIVAVPERRAGHPALKGLAIPVVTIPDVRLRGVATPAQSPRILALYGCGSVAEAMAITASGGSLIRGRRVTGGVTAALAEGPGPDRKAAPATGISRARARDEVAGLNRGQACDHCPPPRAAPETHIADTAKEDLQ